MDTTTPTIAQNLTWAGNNARCPCCGAFPPSRVERRFTILDATILVVASALACTFVRPLITGGLWSRLAGGG